MISQINLDPGLKTINRISYPKIYILSLKIFIELSKI